MKQIPGVALTAVANLLLGAAILIFAVGFFPHKAFLPGLATWPDGTALATRISPFDKVIFMVVDALRSDFVYGNGSNFHFTQSLIRDGAAIPFTGHASPPTITMPRVKAITTGSVPSFLDLVLNFAESDTTSTLATQDSWLAQLKAKPNGKLIMYGDDTWLRLFPNFFARTDGTTSFFVSDFTEVDLNVTRHVPEELLQSDWTGMIMHYLGLDHIGHKTGPKGPNMPAKQLEMDNIVRQIYESMEQLEHLQSSVLVLLGDHGMNEAGNHGANSAGEVSTALTFISPKFKSTFEGFPSPVHEVKDYRYYDEVEQSDIAPTLAALLGFPIPQNSLGCIIPRLLDLWASQRDRFEMLFSNAEQIKKVAQATYPLHFDQQRGMGACSAMESLSDAEDLACQWEQVNRIARDVRVGNEDLGAATQIVKNFLRQAQALLSGTASKYDLTKMYLGTGLGAAAVTLSAINMGTSLSNGGWPALAFGSTVLIYVITMFATSYVEEEHQFWYWMASAWLLVLNSKATRFQMKSQSFPLVGGVLASLLFGIIRRWNQTGQKYAGEPDIVAKILLPNPPLLWSLIFGTYAYVPQRLRKRPVELRLRQMAILPVLVGASALLFKLAFTWEDSPELLEGMNFLQPVLTFSRSYPLESLARLVFLGLLVLIVTAIYCEQPWIDARHRAGCLQTLHEITSLFLITQSRTVNIPLFLIFHLQVTLLLQRPPLQTIELSLTSLLMQYSSFFAFGGTNAISSVDLSNAYNGVGGYNVGMVGILTFVSNWAGPIWWASATMCILSQNSRTTGSSRKFSHFGNSTLFTSTAAVAVMAACTLLREHLFIWTVFSPKYLYMMAWTFAQHLLVNGLFSSIA